MISYSKLRDLEIRYGDLALGSLVFLVACLVYLPKLGAFPLWDPWEPHYCQVAREMQEHGSWMVPRYRGLENWSSKPILMLWLLRASFAALSNGGHAAVDSEFAARLPFALFAILGAVLHYDWVRRLFGRWVGMFAALVFLTAPQAVLIGRQVVTDMVMVVTWSSAMGYLAVGLFTERGAQRTFGKRARISRFLWADWPFLLFWSLQAVAVLAKGFVAPVLTVLVLGSYFVMTLVRPQKSSAADGSRERLVAKARRWLVLGSLVVIVTWALQAAIAHMGSLLSEQRELLRAAAVLLGGLVLVFGVLFDSSPARQARVLLSRLRAIWGIPLFFAISAPWYVIITLRRGWPFWHSFIFFHHLGRAAGSIHLPTGSFDFYLRQLGFGFFPWSAFLLAALVLFITRSDPARDPSERRNLYLVLMGMVPFVFFALARTHFAHYIFPVLGAGSVMIAAALTWLVRGQKMQPGGPESPASTQFERSRWSTGTVALLGLLSLCCWAVLTSDIEADYGHLLRVFVYYYNRPMPSSFRPALILSVMALPVGLATLHWTLTRRVRTVHVIAFGASAVALSIFVGSKMMPAMGATYSYKPLYEAYLRLSRPGEPIGQYNDWPQPARSVIFLSNDHALHLHDWETTRRFLLRPGRKFILVDRDRWAELRQLADTLHQQLFVVSSQHPYAYLVSNLPTREALEARRAHVVTTLPSDLIKSDLRFGETIRLLGWRVSSRAVAPGQSLSVTLYLIAERPLVGNFLPFVQGDGPRASIHRLTGRLRPGFLDFPPSSWPSHTTVAVDFTLAIPEDYPNPWFFLWAGFAQGTRRLPVPLSPYSDGHGRARGPLIRMKRP